MSTEEWKSTEEYWEKRYNDGQTGWDRGDVHPALLDWIREDSLKPCNILIPGCGNGYEVLFLAESGFDVTAIDFADTPIKEVAEKLKRNGLTANLMRKDFLLLHNDFPFDAIYEQTCLCALEPQARKKYEEQACSLLKPGGKLFALFMQTEHPATGPPFHCDIPEMKKLFAGDHWSWTGEQGMKYEHPSGSIFEIASTLVRK